MILNVVPMEYGLRKLIRQSMQNPVEATQEMHKLCVHEMGQQIMMNPVEQEEAIDPTTSFALIRVHFDDKHVVISYPSEGAIRGRDVTKPLTLYQYLASLSSFYTPECGKKRYEGRRATVENL